MRYTLTFLSFIATIGMSYSMQQDTTVHISQPILSKWEIGAGALNKLNGQYSNLDKSVQQSAERVLDGMQRQESKLREALQKRDSSRAQQLFAGSAELYQKWKSKLQGVASGGIPVSSLNGYVPKLDSVSTAMQFLKQGGNLQSLASGNLQQVQALNGASQQLQGRLQIASDIKDFAKQREQQLKDQLSSYGLGKQLLAMNKTVYYYQQEFAQYKGMLNDKQKMQDAVLSAIRQSPAIQRFFQKNSWLSQLFPQPAGYGTPAGLEGSQTKTSVETELKQRFGGLSTNPVAYMQNQVQPSQGQMDQLQDRISSLGSLGSSGDITAPDFAPNGQKTKTFLKRLEFGFNIQSQKTSTILPTTSALALTIGYKLTDKATIGWGCSYNIGWGTSIQHLQLSSQGASLRTYADIKAKGSIWITGGLEYNYFSEFSHLSDINNLNVWQKSALIGVTKKYTVDKRSGNVQLLFDLLSKEHIPQTQALVFRVGYTL